MRHHRMRVAAMAVAILVAVWVAACSSSSSKPATSSSSSSASTPVTGGTLRFVAASDFDHIDPLSAYLTNSFQIERAYARQLVSQPASNNFNTAISIVPDIATVVPSTSNGGPRSDGLAHTVHPRPNALGDSRPPPPGAARGFHAGVQRSGHPADRGR